jgi:hypothetical protein
MTGERRWDASAFARSQEMLTSTKGLSVQPNEAKSQSGEKNSGADYCNREKCSFYNVCLDLGSHCTATLLEKAGTQRCGLNTDRFRELRGGVGTLRLLESDSERLMSASRRNLLGRPYFLAGNLHEKIMLRLYILSIVIGVAVLSTSLLILVFGL